jgi:hypothetical protein
MTISQMIYDIREIVNSVSDDSDISNEWLYHKMNIYREVVLLEKYKEDPHVDPAWLVNVPVIKTKPANPADDPSITYVSVHISKAIIPEPISLPDDLGLIVTGSSGIIPYEKQSLTLLAQKAMIKEHIDNGMGYYARVGAANLYLYPLTMEVKLTMIPKNPLEIQVLENNAYRDRTLDDEYPVDADTAEKIILLLLERELSIKLKTVNDLVNDSQDQFNILTDGGTRPDQ